jgi:hypothetical protein
MAYALKWESMSEACEHGMTAAGSAKDEAKRDIGQMIADRVVEIRITLREHATRSMRSPEVLDGEAFDIPTTLKPEDFDWERVAFTTGILAHRENRALPDRCHKRLMRCGAAGRAGRTRRE